uniref:Uncharacterized protein n=1 Tax=Janibacter limosus TaxID=53458 RepID=A0AC61U1G6_9MICO|nr:hypothetical protein [Janibacter limosus]
MLSAQFTVLLTAVRSWFVPVVVVLVAAPVWNVHRSQRLRRETDRRHCRSTGILRRTDNLNPAQGIRYPVHDQQPE